MRNGARLRRFVRLVVVLALAAAFAGCWDRREIEQTAFVTALGIDRAAGGGDFTVTAALAEPRELQAGGGDGGGRRTAGGAGGGEDAPRWVVTGTGSTVFEAYRSIQETSPRRLSGAHVQVVVIGEELCRQGVAPVEEFLDRNPEFRRTINFMAAEGPAQPIVMAVPDLERLMSQTFRGISLWHRLAGTGWVVTVLTEREMIAAEGQELACGRIRLTTGKQAPSLFHFPAPTGYPGVQEAAEPEAERREHPSPPVPIAQQQFTATELQARRTPELLVAGGSVFKGDKLAGWMNRQETRGFLYLRNDRHQGLVTVTVREKKPVKVTLETKRFRTRRQVLFRHGLPEIAVEIRWEGNVGEVAGDLDITRPGGLAQLEKLAAAAIQRDVEACLRRVQKQLKSDVVGFGASIRRTRPRVWKALKKDWDRLYPEVKVHVAVRAKLRRVGVVTRPLKAR